MSSLIKENPIGFKHGSDELSDTSLTSLAEIREVLAGCVPGFLTIEGHTDSMGTSALNLDLSARRASSVMKEFIALGVEQDRMRSLGFGEKRPIANNETRRGRALNRRIELSLVSASEMLATSRVPDDYRLVPAAERQPLATCGDCDGGASG